MDDFIPTNRVEFVCSNTKTSPLEFALKQILKMSNNTPNNNLYKSIVAKKNPKSVNDLF